MGSIARHRTIIHVFRLFPFLSMPFQSPLSKTEHKEALSKTEQKEALSKTEHKEATGIYIYIYNKVYIYNTGL